MFVLRNSSVEREITNQSHKSIRTYFYANLISMQSLAIAEGDYFV